MAANAGRKRKVKRTDGERPSIKDRPREVRRSSEWSDAGTRYRGTEEPIPVRRSNGKKARTGKSANVQRSRGKDESASDVRKNSSRNEPPVREYDGPARLNRVRRTMPRKGKLNIAAEKRERFSRGVIPLQPNYVPAKNKSYGCSYCKYAQHREGFDAEALAWEGRLLPMLDGGRPHVIKNPKIAGIGKDTAKIMIVADAPGKQDDTHNTGFASPQGMIVKANLLRAKIPLEQVYFTHALRCRVPFGKNPTYPDCVPCSCYLSEEIQRVKPDVIVPLGKASLQALLGSKSAKITEAHANPFNATVAEHKAIIFPLWNPAYVIRNDYLRTEYADAFIKLREVALGSSTVEDDPAKYVVLTDAAKCIKVLSRASKTDNIVAFDFETSGLNSFAKGERIACISVCFNEKFGYTIPTYSHRFNEIKKGKVPAEIAELGWDYDTWRRVVAATKKFLKSKSKKIGHNVKFDCLWSWEILGVRPNNIVSDTMLLHSIIDENAEHGLKPLVLRFTNMGPYEDGLEPYLKKTKKRYDLVPYRVLGEYAAKDAVATLRVYNALIDLIANEDEMSQRIAASYLPRALQAFIDVEYEGAAIDINFAEKSKRELQSEIDLGDSEIKSNPQVRSFIRTRQAQAIVDKKKFKFSLDSPQQMSELFFKYMKYPSLKKTDSGADSTDKEVLQYLTDEHGCALASVILKYRLNTKLQNTYVAKLLELALLDPTHPRIHGRYNLNGCVTGRLCVSGDTRLDTSAGSFTIESLDLIQHPKCTILTHKGRQRPILNKYYKGLEEMYEVTTASGKAIRCTKGHRFLTRDGWQHLRDLAVGDALFAEWNLLERGRMLNNRSLRGSGRVISHEGCRNDDAGQEEERAAIEEGIQDSPRNDDGSGEECDRVRGSNPFFYVDPIVSIVSVGVLPVWDIEVEEDHSYVAQGFVNHNSSADPNMQNIPNKGASIVKRMIVSRFGKNGCILQGDYSQIELRVLASVSRDKVMLKVYRDGKDIHKETTLSIFPAELKKLGKGTVEEIYDSLEESDPATHKKMRTVAKRINFGVCYGIGAEGIVNLLRSEGIVITEEEAAEYIDRFYRKYPGVDRWIKNVRAKLERDEKCVSVYGRTRHLPAVASEDHELVAQAKRQGPNFMIQNPASETTVTACILLSEYIKKHKMKSRLIMNVHDSIVIDAHRSEVAKLAKVQKTIMENIPKYGKSIWGADFDFSFLKRVPIIADIDVGVNYADCIKLNDKITITEALAASEEKAAKFLKEAA